MSIEWNGEGLPPVGCECEVKAEDFYEWTKIKVVYVHNGEIAAVTSSPNTYLNDRIEKFSAGYNAAEFRPLRTEAERKREEAKHAIAELCRSSASNGHSADLIYDAIAAGKIPHITLK
ncbi:hypothetical protein HA41_00405 [Pantoea conspicua]|uniref:Uncharacterized protein n=1 Tax=Pantoea conspicua TaxID=472705 RepID=A0A1X1C2N0_9GAMM|nr:hypothetical protein [Pantoea conspicua]ORM55927.1 hypothetical protein HA41_00405 [Pantoea conspicua]